jgi:hypothetical protein
LKSRPSPPARRARTSKPFWNRSSELAMALSFSDTGRRRHGVPARTILLDAWSHAEDQRYIPLSYLYHVPQTLHQDEKTTLILRPLVPRFRLRYHCPCGLFLAQPEGIDGFILQPRVGEI